MFEYGLLGIVVGLPGLIIAMVVHEYAHARVAVALGDFTPRLMGRLTLNPMSHIDPIGLLMLILIRFGWAKPVIINPNNFKNPKRDDILVSLAGPAANIITAFAAYLVIVLFIKLGFEMTNGTQQVLLLIMIFNVNFAIFNLIPLPPLDGSHVLRQLLPWEYAQKLDGLERYSFLILIVILMTPILGWIFIPAQRFILSIFDLIGSFLL